MTAPLRFSLVPTAATKEIRQAAQDAIPESAIPDEDGAPIAPAVDWENARYAAMLAASPGNDLLERIVRARDKVNAPLCERTWADACRAREEARAELMDALDELGGGHVSSI